MIEFKKGSSLVRVWEGDSPVPTFTYDKEKEVSFTEDAVISLEKKRVVIAVEKSAHVGPRILYGFIGGVFEASEGGKLEVVVNSVEELKEETDHDLANITGMSFLGLDSRSASAIAEAIKDKVRCIDSGFNGGRLLIDSAISSEIGSSPKLFRELADYLCELVISRLNGSDLPEPQM